HLDGAARVPQFGVEDGAFEIAFSADRGEGEAVAFDEVAKRGEGDDVDVVAAGFEGVAEAEKRVDIAVAAERSEQDAHWISIDSLAGMRSSILAQSLPVRTMACLRILP